MDKINHGGQCRICDKDLIKFSLSSNEKLNTFDRCTCEKTNFQRNTGRPHHTKNKIINLEMLSKITFTSMGLTEQS